MKDKKKIFGLIGIIVTTTVSTVITQWMTDREIESKIDGAITEKQTKNEES